MSILSPVGMQILIRDTKNDEVYSIEVHKLASELDNRISSPAARLIRAVLDDNTRPLDERERTVQRMVDEALLENETDERKVETEAYLAKYPDLSIENQLELYPQVLDFQDGPTQKKSIYAWIFPCLSEKEHALHTLEAALNTKITEIRGRWHEEERARSV